MARYRSKLGEVIAKQWLGTAEAAEPIVKWILDNGGTATYVRAGEDHALRLWNEFSRSEFIAVKGREGERRAEPGDFIAQGFQVWEFYIVPKSIFLSLHWPWDGDAHA